jgi:hypothetical protein
MLGLYMSKDSKRISTDLTNFLRAAGGPFIGAMLSSAGCFDRLLLEQMWSEDDDDWDLYFKANRAVRGFKDVMSRRSVHSYALPSERAFKTLKLITEFASDFLIQSFLMSEPQNTSSMINLALAKEMLPLIDQNDLDQGIIMGLLIELAILMRESPALIRDLEKLQTMTKTSTQSVLDVIGTHSTGPMNRLTTLEYEEVEA